MPTSPMKRWFEGWRARIQQDAALQAHLARLPELSHRAVVYAGLTRLHLTRSDAQAFVLRIPADLALHAEGAVAPETLLAAGWSLADGRDGLAFVQEAGSAKAACRLVARAVARWFGGASGGRFSVALEPDRPADRPSLRAAMRALAGARNEVVRHRVYQELIQAELGVAVQRGDEGGPEPWEDPETLGGRPVWRCFSGPEALADHRGVEHVTTSGIRLVRAALHADIGALRIDFSSSVGGELYAHELAAIAQAIPAARPPGWVGRD